MDNEKPICEECGCEIIGDIYHIQYSHGCVDEIYCKSCYESLSSEDEK